MTTAALALLAVGVIADPTYRAPSPFTDDVTISYETAAGGVVINGMHPDLYAGEYSGPSRYAVRLAPLTGEPLAECEVNDGCFIGEDCAVPDPDDPALDDRSVYEFRYGIVVQGYGDYGWPTEPSFAEWIKRLRTDLQLVHAEKLQAFGVSLRVQHIHFVEWESSLGRYGEQQRTFAVWQTLDMAAPVRRVMRLKYQGGGYAAGTVCDDLAPLYVADAAYTPTLQGGQRRMRTLAHELGHVLGAAHSQCYPDPDEPLLPIERCNGGCYPFATVCPAQDVIGYMGYCGHCYQTTTLLRIGPYRGPMHRVAWKNVRIEAAQGCYGDPVGGVPESAVDTDGDGYRVVDNCRTVYNPDQTDTDMDRHGDACDACQIRPGNGAGWWLVLPALALVARRKGRG